MASNFLKLHLHSSRTPTLFPAQRHNHRHFHLAFNKPNGSYKQNISSLSIQSSLSPSTPPSSKEDAILQARTCLSTCLEKPLNNPKLAGKLKKMKQPRFQVEIPVIDDSPSSLTQLALDIFKDMSIKRKGSLVEILVLWPNASLKEAAIQAFESCSLSHVQHLDLLPSVISENNRILSSADVAVFLAPEPSQLSVIKAIADSFYPKPVVIFNPKWGFEEEKGFGDLKGFAASFEVIYSFMGLEVQGVLSKRKGMVFRCVRDGVLSGEQWAIIVEEEDGQMKVVSKFKSRPGIEEVENVLYNLMAINSPLTKSAKFLRDLVSNVTGKK
ncbi:hypothetical protein CCACVL1_12907 [Corchorus capsularis]|uniref:DUF1995 domain-containing protein n=1 Tax=Corchorus capsularis TaxID=210143 RepID=A0A1R3IDA6_COCAP|nr:hypothetical protein CCACVL1_12907 [Corchorus capsularis]